MAWLTGWSKRKKITLTGGASGAQTDYQLKLTIAYDGDMQADFDDLRFTLSDGTTLVDAWLESKVSSVSAIVWAEFPTTPANTATQDYYMYYGNGGVSSYWDIDTTFVFGDDFLGSTLSSKWTLVCGSVSLSGGIITLTTPSAYTPAIYGDTAVGVNYASRMKVAMATTTTRMFHGFSDVTTCVDRRVSGDGAFFMHHNAGTIYSETLDGGTRTETLEDGSYDTSYHIYEVIRNSSTAVEYTEDDVSYGSISTNVPDANMYPFLSGGSYAGHTLYADWAIIRKYAVNPATYGLGGEESAPTAGNPYWYYNLLQRRN